MWARCMGAKGRLRKGGQAAAQLARAAAEGYERGQADAQAAVGAAQAEAAAREETIGATTRALKVALAKLGRVRGSATSMRPWCRRTSIQPVRYIDEPRALIVMRGVFDEDFYDSAAAKLRAKRHWVLQGGDAREGGVLCASTSAGLVETRRQRKVCSHRQEVLLSAPPHSGGPQPPQVAPRPQRGVDAALAPGQWARAVDCTRLVPHRPCVRVHWSGDGYAWGPVQGGWLCATGTLGVAPRVGKPWRQPGPLKSQRVCSLLFFSVVYLGLFSVRPHKRPPPHTHFLYCSRGGGVARRPSGPPQVQSTPQGTTCRSSPSGTKWRPACPHWCLGVHPLQSPAQPRGVPPQWPAPSGPAVGGTPNPSLSTLGLWGWSNVVQNMATPRGIFLVFRVQLARPWSPLGTAVTSHCQQTTLGQM